MQKISEDALKAKEQWLREEIRASRTIMHNLIQWGVTVTAAAELNLYYIRKDIYLHLVAENVIKEGDLFPFMRWIIGTLFLCVIAWAFLSLMRQQVRHHLTYRAQLLSLNGGYSHISENIPIGGRVHLTPGLLFFSVPAFDIALWTLYFAGREVHFSIPW